MGVERTQTVVGQQHTIVALLESVDQVIQVVRNLHGMGLKADQVSLLAKDRAAVRDVVQRTGAQADEGVPSADDIAESLEPKGRAPMGGAVLGGAVGFLIGLTALAIPGFGTFLLASGPLAIALHSLTVSAAGVGMGALFGAIFDERVTEDHRDLYQQRLEEGWWMVLIQAADSDMEQVVSVLEESRVAHVDGF